MRHCEQKKEQKEPLTVEEVDPGRWEMGKSMCHVKLLNYEEKTFATTTLNVLHTKIKCLKKRETRRRENRDNKRLTSRTLSFVELKQERQWK